MKSFLKYAKNRYSQNGEDGILAEIFKRLGIKTGWFVEFGAWDGKHLSNTYALLEKGWRGVDIEGDKERYKDLRQAAKKFHGRLTTINAFVSTKGKNSLDNLLKATKLPRDIDLLSIDIDSYDYLIWQALKNYNPKIVVIEINSSIPLGKEHIQPDGIGYEELEKQGKTAGSSFTSMLKLGHRKGYDLVAHTGNMIFIRKDLMTKINLPQDELDNPNGLFLTDWLVDRSLKSRISSRLKKLSSRS